MYDHTRAKTLGYELRAPSKQQLVTGVRYEILEVVMRIVIASWRSENKPMSPEKSERQAASLEQRRAEKRSILDFVRDSAVAKMFPLWCEFLFHQTNRLQKLYESCIF